MTSRLSRLDRIYQRRMAVALPLAALILWVGMLSWPEKYVIAPRRRVGYMGPLPILPEVDIVADTEEESHTTAAPTSQVESDFVALDIDYALTPEAEPRPEPNPVTQEATEKTLILFSNLDDIQDAIRTTGHPVLAQTDYELVYMQRPVYPREAIQLGIEGRVEVMMLVNVLGRVSQVYVVNPDHYPLLERAAAEAVVHSLFRSYVVDGKPTPFWIRVPVEFKLVD